MDFCPKCGGRLVPRKIWVEKEEPQYMKGRKYGIGWR